MMMQVHNIGGDDPDIAVVGGVHGDEPCGPAAIEQFLDADHDLQQPVKLVIANEEALDREVRYIDTDLNRTFPGDAGSDKHEERLAAQLVDELHGCQVLDLHSTRSFSEPFAIVDELNRTTARLIRATGVRNAVNMEQFSDGDLINHCRSGVVVECGKQGADETVESAYRVMLNFLAAHGVLDATYELTDPAVFRATEKVPKPHPYTVHVDNFERVEHGTVYADGEDGEKTAAESFYPVLMSETGYKDILGFKAESVGALSQVMEERR